MKCRLATKFADRLMKSRSAEELGAISSEIKAQLNDLTGFEDWLRDIYISAYKTLTEPKLIPEECLNSAGLKALAKGEIVL